jgi:hypothetical protein
MTEASTHPGLSHVTVVPSNYDADEASDAGRRGMGGAARGERPRTDDIGR